VYSGSLSNFLSGSINEEGHESLSHPNRLFPEYNSCALSARFVCRGVKKYHVCRKGRLKALLQITCNEVLLTRINVTRTEHWGFLGGGIVYFTSKMFNSTPQALSSTICTGIELDFQVRREYSSQVNLQARKLSRHVHDQSSAQHNFQKAIVTLQDAPGLSVVAQHHAETTSGVPH
jgi:hypothetical protein